MLSASTHISRYQIYSHCVMERGGKSFQIESTREKEIFLSRLNSFCAMKLEVGTRALHSVVLTSAGKMEQISLSLSKQNQSSSVRLMKSLVVINSRFAAEKFSALVERRRSHGLVIAVNICHAKQWTHFARSLPFNARDTEEESLLSLSGAGDMFTFSPSPLRLLLFTCCSLRHDISDHFLLLLYNACIIIPKSDKRRERREKSVRWNT